MKVLQFGRRDEEVLVETSTTELAPVVNMKVYKDALELWEIEKSLGRMTKKEFIDLWLRMNLQ